jgi:hypothetical protein
MTNFLLQVKNIQFFVVFLFLSFGFMSNAVAKPMCSTPKEKWMTESELRRELRRQGYFIGTIRVVEDCYELYGLDPRGRRIQILIEPGTARPAAVRQASEIENQ